MRFLRPVLILLVFFAALFGTGMFIGRIAPFDGVPMVKEKMEYWERHKDEYDTVFIGTSRTYRGIIPSVFDRLNAEAGVPTRTFNFGIDGMHAPEDAFVAEAILANPPKNLRHVFLEIGVFAEKFGDRDPRNVRSIYWHDWERTSICVRANLWPKKRKTKWKQWFELDEDDPRPISVALTHLDVYFSRAFSTGRGATLWNRHAFNRNPPKQNILGKRMDGFVAMRSHSLEGRERDEYMAKYAERQAKAAKIAPMDRYGDESLAGTVARVRELGAKPYVLLAPTTSGTRGRPSESESTLPVFDFCDLVAFPELFEPKHRTDIAHVNAAGADLFTRRAAAAFIAHSRPPSSPQR